MTKEDEKREQVYEILLMPIECTIYSKKKANGVETGVAIKCENGKIITTQTYWPEYEEKDTGKPFRYPFNPDCDMSDFAIDFYQILYKDILEKNSVLSENGGFFNKEFAGDTMTSASILKGLKVKYHCLANFWLMPMHIGRASSSTPIKFKGLSKTSDIYPIQDYMDRFLILLKQNFKKYEELYADYFRTIKSFERFAEIHMLQGSYVDEGYEINRFSIWDVDKAKVEKMVFEMIETRAKAISESKYAEELWEYFHSLSLFN